jgi:hypothetical protein
MQRLRVPTVRRQTHTRDGGLPVAHQAGGRGGGGGGVAGPDLLAPHLPPSARTHLIFSANVRADTKAAARWYGVMPVLHHGYVLAGGTQPYELGSAAPTAAAAAST